MINHVYRYFKVLYLLIQSLFTFFVWFLSFTKEYFIKYFIFLFIFRMIWFILVNCINSSSCTISKWLKYSKSWCSIFCPIRLFFYIFNANYWSNLNFLKFFFSICLRLLKSLLNLLIFIFRSGSILTIINHAQDFGCNLIFLIVFHHLEF